MDEGVAFCRMIFNEKDEPEDWEYLAVNKAFQSLVGFVDVINKRVTEVIPDIKETNPEIFEIYGRVAMTGKPEKFERFLPTLSQWFDVSAYSPKKGFFVAIFNLTTKIKQAEKEIKEQHRLSELLLDSLPHPAMLIQGKNRIVLAVNKTALDLGVKVGGHCWRDFGKALYISEEEKNIAESNPDPILDRQIACSFCQGDDCLQKDPKQNNPEIHSLGAVFDTYWIKIDDDVYLHYTIDITERKSAEKALIKSERLSAVGEMASGMAHDFNNSLQVIFGNLEMALSVPDLPQEVLDFIEGAKSATNNSVTSVRNLQRFARKLGNVSLVPVDLNKILDETVASSRPMWKNDAAQNGLHFSFARIYGNIGFVSGNEGDLSNVFYNLIKNAIEAMPGGGLITIETSVLNQEVMVRFSDTGIGMSEEVQKSIFQPYFSTKGPSHERGFGLSNVHSIMASHGGRILVKESVVGQGTTFELIFPVINVMPLKSIESNVTNCQTPAKVLWVDDEEPIRNLAKLCLKRFGHTAEVADSGEAALELLQYNQYDLLVTDISMEGISGWQLAEVIKGKFPEMRIAVISGYGAEITTEKIQSYGVDYVLCKPVSKKEIGDLVDKAMQSK